MASHQVGCTLSWVLFPLLIGYAIYSIINVEKRGWYSLVLNMPYGYLLMFGFITMTPQVSVRGMRIRRNADVQVHQHLHRRLVRFVIKMPTLYRNGCLRCYIIFLIYLYQRWVYRVDPMEHLVSTSMESHGYCNSCYQGN
ncbi:unnamed protein product [Caenorhabditis brenneri]